MHIKPLRLVICPVQCCRKTGSRETVGVPVTGPDGRTSTCGYGFGLGPWDDPEFQQMHGRIRWDRTVDIECERAMMPASLSRNGRTFLGPDDDRDNDDDTGTGTVVVTKTKPKVKRPSQYRVLLLNDDYTPMEFVVHVLERFFQKSREDATRVMLHVHHHGVGECGVFTYEVAETKVTQVMDFARKHQHPLQCIMEKK